MSNLLEMPIVLASLAFLGGYVLAKLGALLGRRNAAEPKQRDVDMDRHTRAVEADLRVTQKKLDEAETSLSTLKEERGELRAQLDETQQGLMEATTQLEDLRGQLSDECEKTQTLRTELTERAEQSIRAQVQIRDMETELSLAHAGSAVDQDEMDRLIGDEEDTDELSAGEKPARGPGDLALDC